MKTEQQKKTAIGRLLKKTEGQNLLLNPKKLRKIQKRLYKLEAK